MDEFLRFLASSLGAGDIVLDAHTPIGAQLSVDSVKIIELTILLEEELGMDLPDDVDLRQETAAGLLTTLTG
jgi:acyl carrier protein